MKFLSFHLITLQSTSHPSPSSLPINPNRSIESKSWTNSLLFLSCRRVFAFPLCPSSSSPPFSTPPSYLPFPFHSHFLFYEPHRQTRRLSRTLSKIQQGFHFHSFSLPLPLLPPRPPPSLHQTENLKKEKRQSEKQNWTEKKAQSLRKGLNEKGGEKKKGMEDARERERSGEGFLGWIRCRVSREDCVRSVRDGRWSGSRGGRWVMMMVFGGRKWRREEWVELKGLEERLDVVPSCGSTGHGCSSHKHYSGGAWKEKGKGERRRREEEVSSTRVRRSDRIESERSSYYSCEAVFSSAEDAEAQARPATRSNSGSSCLRTESKLTREEEQKARLTADVPQQTRKSSRSHGSPNILKTVRSNHGDDVVEGVVEDG